MPTLASAAILSTPQPPQNTAARRDPIKVYDARWEVDEFADDQVARLFEASLLYAREIGVDTIVFTRDARLGCGRVIEIGLSTALKAGFRVFARLEPISTPQGYFSTHWVTQTYPRTMGLGITASHNPAQYIGVKFTVPTVAAIGQDCGPKGGLTRIRQIYHSEQTLPARAGGSLTLLDLSREYIDYSLKAAGVSAGQLSGRNAEKNQGSGLRVVLDTFNGSAGPEMYQALVKAGCEVHPLRLVPDGRFPTGSPNPTSQGKMLAAVDQAARIDAHAVIGIDGDGDRIVFGGRRGILTAGFAFVPILAACGISPRNPVPVLYDPKVSPLALAEWGKLGAICTLFRNGHSQIKDYMTQIGALAAAEESGHYYHRLTLSNLVVSGENSILTVLLFLKSLHERPTLMDELWAMQERVFTTGEFNYQFADDATRDAALDAVIEALRGEGCAIVTATPDGIDLQGTCVSRGVDLRPGAVRLDPGWYSGYLRVATNEKGVVRSYFSAGETGVGVRVEALARAILEQQFKGKVVE